MTPSKRANARSLVRDLRIGLWITQDVLAAMIGVSRSTVSTWEHGTIPCHESYNQLVRIYGQMTMLPLEDGYDRRGSSRGQRSRGDEPLT